MKGTNIRDTLDDDSVGDDGGSGDDSHKIGKYSRSVT